MAVPIQKMSRRELVPNRKAVLRSGQMDGQGKGARERSSRVRRFKGRMMQARYTKWSPKESANAMDLAMSIRKNSKKSKQGRYRRARRRKSTRLSRKLIWIIRHL